MSEVATRTSAGQFSKIAGPGRPSRQVEQAYLEAFRGGCTAEDITAIVKNMVEFAKAGDVNAAKLILDRALPKNRLEDALKDLSGEDGKISVFVVDKGDLEKRKERLRKAVVR